MDARDGRREAAGRGHRWTWGVGVGGSAPDRVDRQPDGDGEPDRVPDGRPDRALPPNGRRPGTARGTVRRRVTSYARHIARILRRQPGIPRHPVDGWPRVGAAVAAVAEGRSEPGREGSGAEEFRRAGDRAEQVEPAPLVLWYRDGQEQERRRAWNRRLWDQFGRGEVVAVVSPNPEVAGPEAVAWGVYPDGRPAVIPGDWSHYPGDRAWDNGYRIDAWDRLFGRTVAVPAEPAVPGVPLPGGVDAQAPGPQVAVASFDQPCGAWAAALEPAHGADAPVDSASAAVADPGGGMVQGNPFAGFLAEPCGCDAVAGGHTLGDCRWSHLSARFDLEDPYT